MLWKGCSVLAQATDALIEKWGEVIPIALLNVWSLPIIACYHLSANGRVAATWLDSPCRTRGVQGIILRQLLPNSNVSTGNNGDFVAHPQIRVAGMIHSSQCYGNINKVRFFPDLHRIVAGDSRDISSKLRLSHNRSSDPEHNFPFMERLTGEHPHPVDR